MLCIIHFLFFIDWYGLVAALHLYVVGSKRLRHTCHTFDNCRYKDASDEKRGAWWVASVPSKANFRAMTWMIQFFFHGEWCTLLNVYYRSGLLCLVCYCGHHVMITEMLNIVHHLPSCGCQYFLSQECKSISCDNKVPQKCGANCILDDDELLYH